MEVTLEQVERLREKADVSYAKAKEALLYSGGNLLDALIYLEERGYIPRPEGAYYSTRGQTPPMPEEAEEPETPPVINLFINPSAAGPALGETGQSCEPYELKPEDPRGASYAIRVQGNSMEPDFPDESIVFVNHDEMRDGDIGVFCVDGATVIKQWHYDRMLGITYLFSLNRKRSDADLVITASSGRSLVWQGRVMTKKRYPLPGR